MLNRKGIFFIILIGSIPFSFNVFAENTLPSTYYNGQYVAIIGYRDYQEWGLLNIVTHWTFDINTGTLNYDQFDQLTEHHQVHSFGGIDIFRCDNGSWSYYQLGSQNTHYQHNIIGDAYFDLSDVSCLSDDPPPPCQDSEKFCQTSSCIDSSGNLKFATFVRYQDKGNWTNVPQLSYDNPNFPNDHDCTAHLLNFISESDCFCPDDTDNLPSDLWENYTIVPPSQPIASAQNDKFLCAQQCYPKGFIFSNGNCICFDETQNTESANQPPSDSTDQNPADTPVDPSNEAQQLAAVNQNLANMIAQGNDLNHFLSNIADNVATNTNNQGILNDNLKNLGDNIGSGLNNLGDSIGDSLDQLGNSLENKLDDIKNNQEQGFELQGDSALPDDNEYDSTVDEVEEESLADAISQYISYGIPILSYINGTSLQLSGASSSMSVELWGSQVDFDLAPMADILDTMGYILSGISLIVAFGIIANR